MAVREVLELDLRRALAQVETLEKGIDDLKKPVSIPINVTGDAPGQIRLFDERLDDIERGVQEVNSELSEMELSVGRTVADFSKLAGELNISEQEAEDLAKGILESENASKRTADAAREVARQLGLSEDDAGRFATEIGKARGQMDNLDDTTHRTSRTVEGLRSTFSRLVIAAGAFIGIRELGRFAANSIKAFSDLEESTSKANVVFGNFADTVFAFTENAPTQLGSTRQAAIEMASSFGNLFLSVGLGQEVAADMSTTLVQLGTDLASFNNISVDEALEKLRSGLVGQAEPLRTVGVLLSEAAVNAKGLELGLGGSTGKLSESEKVMARYAIIMEQTTTAQGDFARTSEGIANSSRTLSALFGELQAKVGEALAPAFKNLLDIAPELIEGFERMLPAIRDAGIALAEFMEPKPGQTDLLDFLQFITDLPRGFGQVFDTAKAGLGFVGGLTNALQALTGGDFSGFIAQIQGIDTAFEELGRTTAERTGIQTLLDDIRTGVAPALAFANALAFVGRAGVIDKATVERFLQLANLDTRQAVLELQRMIDEAGRLGISAEEVEVLRRAIFDLNAEFFEGDRANADYLANMARIGAAAAEGTPEVLNQVEVLGLLRAEADLLGISLNELLTGGVEKFPELAELIGSLEPATAELGLAQENLNAFAQTFEDTQVRVSGAIDELGKLPEKLKVTKGQFLANLRVSAAEEAEFQLNLLRLFDIAPTLATRFRDQGPQTRELVKGFLSDATSAREAEAILTGNAADITGVFTDALETELENKDLSPMGIQKLAEFMEGFGNTVVAETGVSILQGKIQSAIDRMRFQVDADQISFGGTGTFTVSGGGGGGGGVTVNNTFIGTTTTDLDTAVAQANQSTSAVANLLNNAVAPS